MNIFYCRKSSEASDRQAASIDSQKDHLLELAKRYDVAVDCVFEESMSAKKPGRLEFGKMIKKIESHPGATILVWKLDRLARNPMDEGTIKWLLQNKTISRIITPERIYLPEDNALISAVEFGMANQYIRDLSTNVKRGNQTKLLKGELPGAAPLGYLDNKITKQKEVDPSKSLLIREAFELYATGGYSLKEVNSLMYKRGLTTRGGSKLSKGKLHHTFQNPFYYGTIRRNGQLYPGTHEPIISKILFDQVQDALSGKHHSKKQKHFFPLRGFMNCASCGCLLTATKKKGHVYYYCTNGKGNCSQHTKYLRDESADKLVASVFQEIGFCEEDVEIAYLASKEKTIREFGTAHTQQDELEKKLKTLQQQLANLINVISTDLSMTSVLKPQILSLEADARMTQQQILHPTNQTLDEALFTLEQIKKAFLQACSASLDYLEGNEESKFELAKKILWNLKVQDGNIQQYQLKAPYSLMANVPKKMVLEGWLCDSVQNQGFSSIIRDFGHSRLSPFDAPRSPVYLISFQTISEVLKYFLVYLTAISDLNFLQV